MVNNKTPKYSQQRTQKEMSEVKSSNIGSPSADTHNKIPQEIEDEIIKEVFEQFWDYNWQQNKKEVIKMLKEAISITFEEGQKKINEKNKEGNICCQGCYKLGIEEGQKQKVDDVLKLIDEMINNYRTMYGVKKETIIQSAFITELNKLKAQIKNGGKNNG